MRAWFLEITLMRECVCVRVHVYVGGCACVCRKLILYYLTPQKLLIWSHTRGSFKIKHYETILMRVTVIYNWIKTWLTQHT